MPDCDYCGESFADEDAYLAHLGAEHAGELGPIDRRRVAASGGAGDDEGGFPLGPTVLVGLLVLSGVLVVWVTFFMGAGGGGGGEARDVPDDPLLSDAESFESNGRNHVPEDRDIQYERVPPLSGTHYENWVEAGFYEETPPLGNLVHSLEHGHVVVYYDPGAMTPAARENLTALASNYTARWESVVVAPNPNDDPAAPYVLTAWQVRLRMQEYDPETVQAFLDAFRGRGPENSVR